MTFDFDFEIEAWPTSRNLAGHRCRRSDIDQEDIERNKVCSSDLFIIVYTLSQLDKRFQSNKVGCRIYIISRL